MTSAKGWPSFLILNGHRFSYAEIASGIHLDSPTEFEESTLEFSRQWLSEVNSFELATSGSTGNPKTIVITRKTMQVSAAKTAQSLGLSAGDRALICISTSFIGGKMMLVRGFEIGMNMVAIEPSSNPFEGLSADSHFAFMAVVPLQLESMLTSPHRERMNPMKCILVGGAPIDPGLESMAQQITCPVQATYGMTETASHVALRRINGERRSELFQAMDGIFFDQDSRNCLRIDAPDLLNSSVQTNDVVELAGVDQFRWLGRADNVINSGGVKIHPEVVENEVFRILGGQSLGRRYFVSGIKDPRLGQKLVLVIEGAELPTSEKNEILDRLRDNLAKHHSPKSICFVPQFKETSNGKIKRRETMSSIT